MKGIIFTHFIVFAEERFGLETVDAMIEGSELPSGASYTAVATYDYQELVRMLGALSELTQLEVPSLLKDFGKSLFGSLSQAYPMFVEKAEGAFELLRQVEDHIHVEVLKLYPGSEMPTFDCEMLNQHTMRMIYRSERALADFAEGLILGTFEYYGESVTIHRKNLSAREGEAVQFLLQMGGSE